MISNDPVELFIPINNTYDYSPVKSLLRYVQYFKPKNVQLFQFMDKSPVSYAYVAEKLKSLVMYLGLDPLRYKPHSFRIDTASVALAEGHSEDAICRFGRWDSHAVRKYIRIPSLTLKNQ